MATNKLTARQVDAAKPGQYGDGGGLWLVVSPSGARRWIYRFMLDGKSSSMGLGSLSDGVSLAEARARAAQVRLAHKAGKNPIEARRDAQAASVGKTTFGQAADDLISAKESGWRNEKHRNQWRQTLKTYCADMRSKPVDEITTDDVLAVLKPIWTTKAETASRLRARIEAVLNYAQFHGHIDENRANPARWKGHLENTLAKQPKLSRGHQASLPYEDIKKFVLALRDREAIAALALEFLLLNASRSGEVLGARWAEVDMGRRIWTIPAARMKGGKIHRVPLSPRAVEILDTMSKAKKSEFVFPGRADRPMSNMALEMLLRRMSKQTAWTDAIGRSITVHGFRSTFRDWVGDETSFPREVAEAALSHAINDRTEAAYRRKDALEKRRELMVAWQNYCSGADAEREAGDRG